MMKHFSIPAKFYLSRFSISSSLSKIEFELEIGDKSISKHFHFTHLKYLEGVKCIHQNAYHSSCEHEVDFRIISNNLTVLCQVTGPPISASVMCISHHNTWTCNKEFHLKEFQPLQLQTVIAHILQTMYNKLFSLYCKHFCLAQSQRFLISGFKDLY